MTNIKMKVYTMITTEK